MKKTLFGMVVFVAIVIAIFYAFNDYIYNEKQAVVETDYRNGQYRIDGRTVVLTDGIEQVETAPESSSKIVTRYFGNELETDLNDDGKTDVVFLVTQETGGSGLFYYVVAAVATEQGYVGSDGYLLGDRIAPQTIELSSNPRHKNVIVANYADRDPGEPMAAQPSVGKSAYLKLDMSSMRWGIVVSDFEGEER